jgi:hypothetical protein
MYNNLYSSDPAYPSLELDSEQYPSSEPDTHHEEDYAKSESAESVRDGEEYEKVGKVLDYMASVGLDLSSFISAISWGNARCTSDKSMAAIRTRFLQSPLFPDILQRWYLPPRGSSRKERPQGARVALTTFMSVQFPRIIEAEMKIVRKEFDVVPGKKGSGSAEKRGLDAASLTSFNFKDMAAAIEESAPNLWYLLHSLAWSSKQSRIVEKAGRNIVCKH